MHREKKYIHFFYLIIDIFLVSLSFYLPYCLRYNSSFILDIRPFFIDYFLLFALWGLSLIFFLNNYRLYSTDRSLTIPKEIWKVSKSVVCASILAALAIFVLKMDFFSRLVFASSTMLLILSLSFWRAIKRIIIRHRVAQGHYSINVLIVGAGRAGCALAGEIRNNPYLGLKIVGFLDDNINGKVVDLNILGKIQDLGRLVQKYFVDEIYVSIPSERRLVAEILAKGKKLRKTVRILADNFTCLETKWSEVSVTNGFPFMRMKLDYVGVAPLIGYIDAELHGTELFVKRLLDLFVGGISLILLTPLFIIIAFLIKLDSPGPVLYKCLRCGKKSKIFNFYKFRSMSMGADNHKEALRHRSEVKGPIFKIKKDPRVTRVGSILRRYSLDELPQLLNVLKGDMSLVGPRPPTPDEVDKYDIWQMRRLDVRPGITCLWQIRGRSDLSFYKWMRWDLWYIDNWSFGLDLQILLRTIPVVLKGKGAY